MILKKGEFSLKNDFSFCYICSVWNSYSFSCKGLRPRENYHHTWYRGARLKKAASSGWKYFPQYPLYVSNLKWCFQYPTLVSNILCMFPISNFCFQYAMYVSNIHFLFPNANDVSKRHSFQCMFPIYMEYVSNVHGAISP